MELLLLVLGIVNLLGILFIVSRLQGGGPKHDSLQTMRQEFALSRREFTEANKDLRQEVTASLLQTRESLDTRMGNCAIRMIKNWSKFAAR